MKPFEYAAPETLADATALLADTWGKTEILAGGTDLVTALKQEITSPGRVVSLRNIKALRGISEEGDAIRIGAMVPLGELAAHAAIKKHFPALVTAIEGIGSPQLLTVGTIGGELCQRPRCWYFRNGFGLFAKQGDAALVPEGENRYHAIFGNDGPAAFVSASSVGPVLIALGAALVATGTRDKTRQIAAAEFFQTPKSATDRETVLKPNEILTEIRIPIGMRNATYEVRHRHGLDWPYVTATVAFRLEGGKASNARVVLGHVAPVPWVASDAGNLLNGAAVNGELADKCAQAATKGAKPLSDNGYKVQMVKAAVKRAVNAAAKA